MLFQIVVKQNLDFDVAGVGFRSMLFQIVVKLF